MQTNTPTVNDLYNEKLYDLGMIEKLCRGNQDQVKQMIRAFIDQVPKAVEDIKAAYRKNDFDQVKKEAHRIKPVLSVYSVIKIEEDILQIESTAGLLANSELEQKLNKVDTVVTTIVEQMKRTFLYQ